MSVSIVVGGQYGSEGKGKVAYYWANKMSAAAVVRVGGSNSGHTIYGKAGERYAFRMLPTASIANQIVSVLPAGSYIDIPVLMKEINEISLPKDRLKIDPNAMIISEKNRNSELMINLREKIGSTLSGTGAAVIERISREEKVLLAKDVTELKPFICDTKSYLRSLINRGKHIVIEGTQGYGLSIYHTANYPYATSRDTTASGFLAETGLSPFDVEHVVMVIRAFPIRVAGNSGPLEMETNWEEVSKESGAEQHFDERTTVTNQIRRVAYFTPKVVKDAIIVNRPDIIFLNHMDYIDIINKNRQYLSNKQKEFLEKVEKLIGEKIAYCGNGEMNIISMEVNHQ